eukprot:jgi/Phyca11/106180/e_gw1.12.901.1
MQQLLVFTNKQQQATQAQMQAQLQAQMQQPNARFEYRMAARGDQKKSDPPMYEGKYAEDIELWIFATEQYYASRRELMEADSPGFVTIISSNLGKSVLNWYRAFITECERVNITPTWSLFKQQLRTRFRPKDFEYDLRERMFRLKQNETIHEYDLRERMFRLKQNETIHEYVSKFQDLLSQTELAISELEKRSFFRTGYVKKQQRRSKKRVHQRYKKPLKLRRISSLHTIREKPRAPAKDWQGSSSSGHRAPKSKQQNTKRSDNKKGKSDDKQSQA